MTVLKYCMEIDTVSTSARYVSSNRVAWLSSAYDLGMNGLLSLTAKHFGRGTFPLVVLAKLVNVNGYCQKMIYHCRLFTYNSCRSS